MKDAALGFDEVDVTSIQQRRQGPIAESCSRGRDDEAWPMKFKLCIRRSKQSSDVNSQGCAKLLDKLAANGCGPVAADGILRVCSRHCLASSVSCAPAPMREARIVKGSWRVSASGPASSQLKNFEFRSHSFRRVPSLPSAVAKPHHSRTRMEKTRNAVASRWRTPYPRNTIQNIGRMGLRRVSAMVKKTVFPSSAGAADVIALYRMAADLPLIVQQADHERGPLIRQNDRYERGCEGLTAQLALAGPPGALASVHFETGI